jgi:hypothetical protein
MSVELILTIAAVITALGVIIGSIVAIYRVARRIGDAIGVDRSGRTLSERLERVEHQLWENGGSSLADRVNNIDTAVIKISAEVEFIKNLVVAAAQIPAPQVHLVEESTTQPVRKTRAKKAS